MNSISEQSEHGGVAMGASSGGRSGSGGMGGQRDVRINPDLRDVGMNPDLPPKNTHRDYGKWRAGCLIGVHVLFAIHIVHWKMAGTTLAPLELNEVMYTFEKGIVTAGFLLMVILAIGTMIFGRFFCSWGCHILALQDLCGWLLGKMGIRPKPVRSRMLLMVPVGAVLYMFVWPQVPRIPRILAGEKFPGLHIRGDAEGWASFLTNDFWRNLPPVWMALLTFFVVGFAMVYVLGSRSFCTYGCPYGAVFGLATRAAPGGIRVSDACVQCAACTTVCSSHIRVHEEVREHGMVVNPACLKDLDCVAACPEGALIYGFGKPAGFKSWTKLSSAQGKKSGGGRYRVAYDYSWGEDVFMGAVLLLVLIIFRGLYGQSMFLMSLGWAGMVAFLAMAAVRLGTKREGRVLRWTVKRGGKVTAAGRWFALFMVVLGVFVLHSGFVRYHEYLGWRAVEGVRESATSPEEWRRNSELARGHLRVADEWGLFHPGPLQRALFELSAYLGEGEEAARYEGRLLRGRPGDAGLRVELGRVWAAVGEGERARRLFEEAEGME